MCTTDDVEAWLRGKNLTERVDALRLLLSREYGYAALPITYFALLQMAPRRFCRTHAWCLNQHKRFSRKSVVSNASGVPVAAGNPFRPIGSSKSSAKRKRRTVGTATIGTSSLPTRPSVGSSPPLPRQPVRSPETVASQGPSRQARTLIAAALAHSMTCECNCK